MLIQAFINVSDVNRHIRMGFMQPGDALWRSNQPYKLNFTHSPLFEDVHGRHCRTTCGKHRVQNQALRYGWRHRQTVVIRNRLERLFICLLYTSDAADDLLCVDLGGRRIIKKKTYYKDTEDTVAADAYIM